MTLQCWHVQKFKTFLCKILRDLKTQTTFPGILFRNTKQLWNERGWEKFSGQRYFERFGQFFLGGKDILRSWEVGKKDMFWEVGRSFREIHILRSWEKRYNLRGWEKFWGEIYFENTICFKFSLPQIQGIWFNYSAEFEEWAQKSKI